MLRAIVVLTFIFVALVAGFAQASASTLGPSHISGGTIHALPPVVAHGDDNGAGM